ncbi:hypothetical protein WOU_02468 [Enterococcus faecalis ATCC 6055]|uniref:Uncharacterized protein n=2 Tax=Enterococcus faecalis TaxID=1351 RepID=R3HYY0_ENTFL|nr:hypothetical protein WOU_02468 [Enterococcus faecalis ATCC 6055]
MCYMCTYDKNGHKSRRRYFTRVLEEELQEFMKRRHKKLVTLEQYIKDTETTHTWKHCRKVALHKAVLESNLFVVNYQRIEQGDRTVTCLAAQLV